jgi:hypothetical protein
LLVQQLLAPSKEIFQPSAIRAGEEVTKGYLPRKLNLPLLWDQAIPLSYLNRSGLAKVPVRSFLLQLFSRFRLGPDSILKSGSRGCLADALQTVDRVELEEKSLD